jgi:hypothetical protein
MTRLSSSPFGFPPRRDVSNHNVNDLKCPAAWAVWSVAASSVRAVAGSGSEVPGRDVARRAGPGGYPPRDFRLFLSQTLDQTPVELDVS